jgi:hypothetical protein
MPTSFIVDRSRHDNHLFLGYCFSAIFAGSAGVPPACFVVLVIYGLKRQAGRLRSQPPAIELLRRTHAART